MRRPPQEGQKPRPLQEKATRSSGKYTSEPGTSQVPGYAVITGGGDCSMSFSAYDPVEKPKAKDKTDKLIINLRIPGKKRNKGFLGTLTLSLEPGYIDSDWK